MTKRDYDGDPLDLTWQDIKDRPYKSEGETVYATDSEPAGEERTEGTPQLPKHIDESDVQAVVDWLYETSISAEESTPPLYDQPTARDWSDDELKAYRLGRFLVAEGALDKIQEEVGEFTEGGP